MQALSVLNVHFVPALSVWNVHFVLALFVFKIPLLFTDIYFGKIQSKKILIEIRSWILDLTLLESD